MLPLQQKTFVMTSLPEKYFLIIHPELHIQPDLLPPTAGARVTTQALLIAKEGLDCGL